MGSWLKNVSCNMSSLASSYLDALTSEAVDQKVPAENRQPLLCPPALGELLSVCYSVCSKRDTGHQLPACCCRRGGCTRGRLIRRRGAWRSRRGRCWRRRQARTASAGGASSALGRSGCFQWALTGGTLGAHKRCSGTHKGTWVPTRGTLRTHKGYLGTHKGCSCLLAGGRGAFSGQTDGSWHAAHVAARAHAMACAAWRALHGARLRMLIGGDKVGCIAARLRAARRMSTAVAVARRVLHSLHPLHRCIPCVAFHVAFAAVTLRSYMYPLSLALRADHTERERVWAEWLELLAADAQRPRTMYASGPT